ncbi:hypothetical protein [Lyngbya sp. PCC 8106]|uniref:hypothetical protein n=1 Tax=Lyngbya sp. (strain PCC 8106) TaxID=313612 RepID=UPI0000EAB9FD|nr:hypothetical protein [Lyngbya sp. PCC 8106]EAW33354.1 hypothetical protein L8106_22831 [Lyngbya sp. PCC 8106]
MSNKISQASLTFGAAFAVHELNLSTGTGARAISGIHKYLGLTEVELPGQEGSFGEYKNLQPGVYKIGVWLESQEREAESKDVLFAWNQRDIIAIADTKFIMGKDTGFYETIPLMIAEVEVPYGSLAIILVDETSKTGTTIAHVTELSRIKDLPYPVPIVYDNQQYEIFGSGGYNQPYGYANTGSGSRAASSLDEFMGFSDPIIQQGVEGLIPTEGSIISYSVTPGQYKIIWELISSDNNLTNDGFFIWNGNELLLGGKRELCTYQVSSTRFSSGKLTSEIPVSKNLYFIPFDTKTKTGTTEIRIHRIERIGNLSGISIFPAHISIIENPLKMATKALNSYRHEQMKFPNSQEIITPQTYSLESWNLEWQQGYNWYWHHINPDGQDDSILNQEKQNFDIGIALANEKFKNAFCQTIGTTGLETLAIFNYSAEFDETAAQFAGESDEDLWAYYLLKGLYSLAAEIGKRNNIEENILTTIIPEAHNILSKYLEEIQKSGPYSMEMLANFLLRIKDENYLPPFFENPEMSQQLYDLWVDSWGLD